MASNVTGLRVRVPVAGMPEMRHVRHSGQQARKPWELEDLPPAQWQLPPASFEETTRAHELARLLHHFKPLATNAEGVLGSVDSATDALRDHGAGEGAPDDPWPAGSWNAEQLSVLCTELKNLESAAQHRAVAICKMRAALHVVAHGEHGIRTRRRDDGGAAAGAAEGAAAGDNPP